jgi:hypothetical protein
MHLCAWLPKSFYVSTLLLSSPSRAGPQPLAPPPQTLGASAPRRRRRKEREHPMTPRCKHRSRSHLSLLLTEAMPWPPGNWKFPCMLLCSCRAGPMSTWQHPVGWSTLACSTALLCPSRARLATARCPTDAVMRRLHRRVCLTWCLGVRTKRRWMTAAYPFSCADDEDDRLPLEP